MKRLSQNEIEAEKEDTVFETLDQQRATQGNLEQALADKSHTWPVLERAAALTNEQLRSLNLKARELGRPLTPEETASLLGDKCPHPRVSRIAVLEV